MYFQWAVVGTCFSIIVFLICQASGHEIENPKLKNLHSKYTCNNFYIKQSYQNSPQFHLIPARNSQIVVSLQTLSNSSDFSLSLTAFHHILKFHQVCNHALIEVNNILQKRDADQLYKNLEKLNGYLRKDQDLYSFLLSPQPISKTELQINIKYPPIFDEIKYKTWARLSINMEFPTDSVLIFNEAQLFSDINDFGNDFNILNGKHFRVSCSMFTKWAYETRPTSIPGIWESTRGTYKYTFDHIQSKYNFTTQYFPSTGGGGKGYMLKNGSWNGVVGDVLNGIADIGLGLGETFYGYEVLGYALPITYPGLAFSTGVPQLHYSWKSVYWPLEKEVWILVMGSVLISYVTLIVLVKISSKSKKASKNILNYLLTSFLEQEAKPISRNVSVRYFMACWLLYGLVITTVYRSKLVGLLSFPVFTETPKSFEELANTGENEFHLTLHYLHGAAYGLLKNSKNDMHQKIFRRMDLEEDLVNCFQEAIGTTNRVCIYWSLMSDYVYNRNMSDKFGYVPLIQAPDQQFLCYGSIVYRKWSIFREGFDKVLGVATVMGLVQKWQYLDNEFVRNERNIWEKDSNISKLILDYQYYVI